MNWLGRTKIAGLAAGVLGIGVLTGLAVATTALRGGGAADAGGLPGARAVIDAAKFPSLQAALDAVPPEGGVVRLPPGVFEIREPLVLSRGDVLLAGCGPATHIKNLNVDGKPALVIRHPDGEKVKKEDKLWRIQLADFRITGNEKSGHGIEALLIDEIYIQGLTVSYHGGDGIRLDRCYEDPRIVNSLITYNKATGVNLLGCHDIVVASNQFEENQDALHCIDGYNLCMTGNCVDDHLGHGVVIENTYGSVLSGNMIEECNGTAVILDRDCYGDTISANVIAHNAAGVDLRDAHGCTVSANTFTIMKTDALRIGPSSNRITVTGNNFSDSFIGDGQVKRAKNDLAAAGMVLEGASDVAVSGNVFAGVKPKAIESRGPAAARRATVTGNVLTDVESDHDSLKDSVIADNVK
ncbi:MAG TPA: right-handed parallel beta-helix repeat-containing protein [Pirellulaceae bacterium]|nr:right-handed parallel beta-helix repeat-containing protein [Pirellulaceae bacterium]